MSPPGRPNREYRRAQPEGNRVRALGGPNGGLRAAQADGIPARAIDRVRARVAMSLAKRGLA
jgi:hypothetical protein